MEFISDKLNSITGDALSGINELEKKRNKQKEEIQRDSTRQEEAVNSSSDPLERSATICVPQTRRSNKRISSNTLQAGFAFGGDTYTRPNQPAPPPIGFRNDIINRKAIDQYSSSNSPPNLPTPAQNELTVSEESLYEGDAWTRVWFQRVMILTFLRLLLFIRKVYEDFQATKTYKTNGNIGYFLVSTATLFLPTIVFTTYRVSRYLQSVLPSMRENYGNSGYPSSGARKRVLQSNLLDENKDSYQVTDALMSSSSARNQQKHDEDDGLVTARQTPTNLEEYHDSKSQQGPQQAFTASRNVSPDSSTAKNSPRQEREVRSEFKESVNVDRLVGDAPDKEVVRVTIGASEQILHGLLFIFWQLKRQVDVMGYLVERSCLWRKPKKQEKEELQRLTTGSDGLEWFQDFYAAFLAILAQVYALGAHWSASDNNGSGTSTLQSSSAGLNSAISSDSSEVGISRAAKTLSDALNQQISTNSIGSKDILILSQLLVSSCVILSLLVAVRRRDDGPATFLLSSIGWGSIFASRIIIIALAFVHIGWGVMLPMIVIHILGITCWIYKIAIDSHNGIEDETEDLMRGSQLSQEQSTELGVVSSPHEQVKQEVVMNSTTRQWSILEHIILLAQILILFALPSLFYWPIMFNLKLHNRPYKYFVLILSENFILIPSIWFALTSTATLAQWYLLGAVGGFSIAGFLFISFYICCKPSLTEYFARADELYQNAEQSGVYFEFCSRVFRMPDLSKESFQRLLNQTEKVE